MTSSTNRTALVAAIDATPLTDEVIAKSCELARNLPGAELHVVYAIEFVATPEMGFVSSPTEIVDSGRAVLNRVTAKAGELFGGRVIGHLAVGRAYREILQLATDLEADVIVVGSHGKRAVERFLVGSVSEQVVRKAHCPVLVVRPKEYVADVPEIEPPCGECVATRQATKGASLWCARHTKTRHLHSHTFYESPPSFGLGSQLIRPEGS
jgi:nucleotide-binding universal stress UspA family protein